MAQQTPLQGFFEKVLAYCALAVAVPAAACAAIWLIKSALRITLG